MLVLGKSLGFSHVSSAEGITLQGVMIHYQLDKTAMSQESDLKKQRITNKGGACYAKTSRDL
jgi:hypothetical protein